MIRKSHESHVDMTPQALLALGGPNLVYVRALSQDEIAGIPDITVESGVTLYSVHGADGARLAVLNDREAAFIAARQNDMAPVSVH